MCAQQKIDKRRWIKTFSATGVKSFSVAFSMHDFWSVAQPKFFSLVVEAHVAEGGRFLEQYQKGNPEKRSKNSVFA